MPNGDPIDWTNIDINKALTAYYSDAILSSSIIRFLSRSLPWTNQWPCLKTNGKIFDSAFLDVNQQRLISWSMFYDSVYESLECPTDDVIQDDDMLDGWTILQRKKRDSDRNKNRVESSISDNPKINNADDVFVVVDTYEDAKKVDSLNPSHTAIVKRNRLSQIKKEGTVPEAKLHDVRRDLIMELNQAHSKNMKG
jgi:hypothetical protein